MKRSLTQKQTLMSPRLADTPTTCNKTSNSSLENTGKPTNSESMRRSRSSTMLSLAALSMGATAGVLLSSHGREASATETSLTFRPLPSEATVNPYVAVDEVVEAETVVKPEIVSATPQPEVIQSAAAIKHTVESGDSLWALSQAYQVPTDDIAASNGMSDQAVLEPGATIRIPRDRQQILATPSSNAPAARQASNTASVSVATNKPEQPKLATDEALEPANAETKVRSKPTPKVIATNEGNAINSENTAAVNDAVTAPATTSTADVTFTQPAPIAAETPSVVSSNTFSEPVVISVPPPQTETVTTATTSAPLAASESLESESVTLEVPAPTSEDVAVVTEEDNTSAVLENPQLLVPVTEAAQVYRVQSGDTIDEIALRYGVSRSDLSEVNQLTDPHQIRVNQELRIPQPQSLTRDRNQYEALIPNTELEPVNTAIAPQEAADDVVVPTDTLVAQTAEDEGDWQPIAVPEPETPAQNTEASNHSSGNHFERLKADIERMREEYRNERRNNEQTPETPLENLSGSRSATSSTTVATAIEESNPEWQTDSNNGVIEVQVQDRRQPLTAPQVQARPQTQPLNRSNTSVQVAAAPTNPGNYNPLLQPNGQQVEPNIPPLNPENYLPENPPQFNGFTWPAKGVFTSGYGRRWGRMHRGIDIAGPTGTPIVAAASGEIISSGWNSGGYGNLVDIRHPDGSMTRYAHNSKLLVRKGQWVEQGQQIALMGSTGYSTGPHLHFEIHPSGRGAANPMAYLPGR